IYNKLKGKKDKDQCLVKPIDLDDIDLTNVLKYGKDNFSLNSIEEWLTDIFVEDNYDKRWDSYDDSRKNKAIKKMINERENTIAAFLTFKSN
ncbi:hypothetical protein P4G59_16155, partial [Lactiplantibacillus plantarum]